jgi:hypothetical protein
VIGRASATHVLEELQNGVLATPVMRQVAFIDVPSTKAAMTAVRFSVASRFIFSSPCKHLDNTCLHDRMQALFEKRSKHGRHFW